MQQHVDQREQEGRIGLRADRHPFGRAGAGDGKVRLDMHALVAAHARIGVAGDGAGPAGHLDIGAERDDVARVGRIGGDGEGAVPEFAVEMFGMGAFDALPRAETVVDRPPRREKGRERAHVVGGRAAVAEADGEARQTGLVDLTFGVDAFQPRGHDVQRLVPGDRREAWILVAPLLRVGALHRRENSVRIVGLLHETIGFDADPAVRRMHILRVEIRFDFGGDAVFHLHFHEVGTGHAIVAKARHAFDVLGCAHRVLLSHSRGVAFRHPPSLEDPLCRILVYKYEIK